MVHILLECILVWQWCVNWQQIIHRNICNIIIQYSTKMSQLLVRVCVQSCQFSKFCGIYISKDICGTELKAVSWLRWRIFRWRRRNFDFFISLCPLKSLKLCHKNRNVYIAYQWGMFLHWACLDGYKRHGQSPLIEHAAFCLHFPGYFVLTY